MIEESELEVSNLSQEISSGGRNLNIEIYRLEGEEQWALEIVDEFNNSTVWNETFKTDRAALTEAKKSLLEERSSSFVGPEDGKSDGKEWK